MLQRRISRRRRAQPSAISREPTGDYFELCPWRELRPSYPGLTRIAPGNPSYDVSRPRAKRRIGDSATKTTARQLEPSPRAIRKIGSARQIGLCSGAPPLRIRTTRDLWPLAAETAKTPTSRSLVFFTKPARTFVCTTGSQVPQPPRDSDLRFFCWCHRLAAVPTVVCLRASEIIHDECHGND
jgi:hypothetical protein